MSIRDYYHRRFRSDLATMFRGMDTRDVRYTFGNDWMRECSFLPRVAETDRPALLVCLYFTILVDQAMHTYFLPFHRRFEELTMNPKFLVGFGHEAHLNPTFVFQIPIQRGLVSESSIREIIPGGMRLFVDETDDFFRRHMREINAVDFWERLLSDPDVVSGGGRTGSLRQYIAAELKTAVACVSRKQLLEIVMVNDEVRLLEIFELVIRKWFRDVSSRCFEDSTVAWEELLKSKPDLLITDDTMPGMCGQELCERLFNRGITYPVIVNSAWEPTEVWVREFANLGCNVSLLRVPCQIEEIVVAIENALKIKRRASEDSQEQE